MCPNRQIISLYHDEELPSPWKEKMEAHLQSCPECRAVLSAYETLGEKLNSLPAETIQAAQERVWKNLNAPELVLQSGGRQPGEQLARRQFGRQFDGRTWNRSITLPLPVAAAALLIIFISLAALVGLRGTQRPIVPVATASIELDDLGMLPIQDMTGILQYLSSQDYGDFMVIRLPEAQRFSRTGEPALINAADYSRRNVFR